MSTTIKSAFIHWTEAGSTLDSSAGKNQIKSENQDTLCKKKKNKNYI